MKPHLTDRKRDIQEGTAKETSHPKMLLKIEEKSWKNKRTVMILFPRKESPVFF